MNSLALVYSSRPTFVARDAAMLSKHMAVREVLWRGKSSVLPLARAIRRSDAVLSWFALDHAFVAAHLARLLGKPHYVVLGGGDCVAMPAMGYGVFLSKKRGFMARSAVRHSALALPVHEHLARDFGEASGIAFPYRVVPTGFDGDLFRPNGRKERSVLTVGGLSDRTAMFKKGLAVFASAASKVRDAAWVHVGPACPMLEEEMYLLSGCSLWTAGALPMDLLLGQYRKAQVYAQLSVHEGLPTSLCEAMLCGCVPVGTDIPGVADTIGDTGIIIPVGDADAAAEAVREALTMDGSAARERILKLYPEERRERLLMEILDGVT